MNFYEPKWLSRRLLLEAARHFRWVNVVLKSEKTREKRFFDSGLFFNSFFFPMRYRAESFWFGQPMHKACLAEPRRSWCLNKFSLDSIPKSAVFRAFLTEFSLHSISKIICLFAGHLLKEESQPSQTLTKSSKRKPCNWRRNPTEHPSPGKFFSRRNPEILGLKLLPKSVWRWEKVTRNI